MTKAIQQDNIIPTKKVDGNTPKKEDDFLMSADIAPSLSSDNVRENRKPEMVPIHLKMTMTIKEAAAYSSIGVNKIDQMLKAPDCPFVLFVGSKKLVKRKAFEDYISKRFVI